MDYLKRLAFVYLDSVRRAYGALKLAYLKTQFGSVGVGVTMASNIDVIWPRNINIGDNVSIGSHVLFWASSKGKIVIGNDCAISVGVRFITPTHDCNVLPVSSIGINKSIVVGSDVWIGAAATILPGVTIHDGAVVAAGAVVSKDVPHDCVVAGVPARVVKELESRNVRLERGRNQ